MKKSHVIALCILFAVVSLVIIVRAFTLPTSKDDFIASRPTGVVRTAPKETAAPDESAAPTDSETEAPTATPQPTPIARPEVDISKYEGLSTKSVAWGLESSLEDANDPETRG